MKWFALVSIILAFIGALAVAAQEGETPGIFYEVRQNETLSGLAERLDVPADCIRLANNLPTQEGLVAGQRLLIPDDCRAFLDAGGGQVEPPLATEEAAISDAPSLEIRPALTQDETYVVVRGDRLAKIAQRYGITIECLARTNGIPDPNLIYIGQRLLILAACQGAGGGAPLPASNIGGDAGGGPGLTCEWDRNPGRSAPGGLYTARAGDTLDFIACDFGIALSCLESTNPQVELRGRISIGEVLTIDLSCPPWEGPILAEARE